MHRWGSVGWNSLVVFVEEWLMHCWERVSWFKLKKQKKVEEKKNNSSSKKWHVN